MDELALLRPKLCRLKLSGVLDTLEQRLSESNQKKWDTIHFLNVLLTDEVERRDFKNLSRRLTKSELAPEKTLETFDFSFNAKINEQLIRNLATCSFVEKKECVFLLGPSGVGKSHLAQGLGHEACRKGFDVIFSRTDTLLKWIFSGKGDGTYHRRMTNVIRTPLLILDDFGLKTLDQHQQEDLYEIICERYEKAAMIITSNRDFNEWPGVFTNPLMASAAMDRLVHRAVKIVIDGKSYRMDNFTKRTRDLTEKKSVK